MTQYNDNLSLEELQTEKTRREIKVLDKALRPDHRNATVMVGVLSVFLALLGVLAQWKNAAKDAQIAELRMQFTEKTIVDELNRAKQQLSEAKLKLQTTEQQLMRESVIGVKTKRRAEQAEADLAETQQALAAKKTELDETTRRTDLQSARESTAKEKAEQQETHLAETQKILAAKMKELDETAKRIAEARIFLASIQDQPHSVIGGKGGCP